MSDIDLSPDKCNFKVVVTLEAPKMEPEIFTTVEAAKAFAADMLQREDVVKVQVKKIEPDEDASDGERVQE